MVPFSTQLQHWSDIPFKYRYFMNLYNSFSLVEINESYVFSDSFEIDCILCDLKNNRNI